MNVKIPTEVNNELVIAALEKNLALIRFDLNRRVVHVNANFAHAMGYTEQEMIGMQHRQFCFPEFVNSTEYEKFWRDLLAGRSYQDKIERMDAHGERIWLEATYMPVVDHDGKVLSVFKVATNITRRQKNIEEVVVELQQMSEGLNVRAETGITRSQELLESIERIAVSSSENITTLASLQHQAESIRGIVQTIQEIASQTSLLALNAAIEAAHAGEHGRGFDIVAKEVRKLAGRVTESIVEVRRNIEGITKEVANIAQGTNQAQHNISKSQLQIRTAMEEFEDISAASEQLDARARDFNSII
ncbi:methyl-accepting chemotaxis protein [Saccharibacillus sp. CPCC 101409]|uniref:methyl-accepting chemotaxis protein n=1 Tax=Saccharibacillus sp. CPCC 101409 TaxID=3058041 RepID=UPI0026735204|nr:methyl-accepting chemotaxis protein [Saccharibacillus sp. CPCC 101409]MDO3409941.1 methyl-accepting chemotaxis protein [Saccharibacillus sp. CPCC 101409]